MNSVGYHQYCKRILRLPIWVLTGHLSKQSDSMYFDLVLGYIELGGLGTTEFGDVSGQLM
jgi:hypothetical protein